MQEDNESDKDTVDQFEGLPDLYQSDEEVQYIVEGDEVVRQQQIDQLDDKIPYYNINIEQQTEGRIVQDVTWESNSVEVKIEIEETGKQLDHNFRHAAEQEENSILTIESAKTVVVEDQNYRHANRHGRRGPMWWAELEEKPATQISEMNGSFQTE